MFALSYNCHFNKAADKYHFYIPIQNRPLNSKNLSSNR